MWRSKVGSWLICLVEEWNGVLIVVTIAFFLNSCESQLERFVSKLQKNTGTKPCRFLALNFDRGHCHKPFLRLVPEIVSNLVNINLIIIVLKN